MTETKTSQSGHFFKKGTSRSLKLQCDYFHSLTSSNVGKLSILNVKKDNFKIVYRLGLRRRIQSVSRPTKLGTLRSDDGDGNENFKKAIVLRIKTTILHVHHAFLYISLPSLHDYDVKMPNVTFYRGSTQTTTKFPLSFWTWIWFLEI